jgi:hypothetical protein
VGVVVVVVWVGGSGGDGGGSDAGTDSEGDLSFPDFVGRYLNSVCTPALVCLCSM